MAMSGNLLSSPSYRCWPDSSMVPVLWALLNVSIVVIWTFHSLKGQTGGSRKGHLSALHPRMQIPGLKNPNGHMCIFISFQYLKLTPTFVFVQKVPTDQQDQPAEAEQCPLQFRKHHASLHSTYLSPDTLHRSRVQFWCLPRVPIGQARNLASTHPHSSPSLPVWISKITREEQRRDKDSCGTF